MDMSDVGRKEYYELQWTTRSGLVYAEELLNSNQFKLRYKQLSGRRVHLGAANFPC